MDQPANTLDPVRTWVATHVRRAVTGRNGGVRHRDLFGTGGDRWFDEDAVIRRVHADSAMFVGGLRALLLQSLHPLAMAGVAEHSDYRTDPWHRLQRTADFLAATTYGPSAEAERAVARVHAVHERVVGVAPDGRSYAANDPHLLRWVHIAEVDSFLAAQQRYGETPLFPAERDSAADASGHPSDVHRARLGGGGVAAEVGAMAVAVAEPADPRGGGGAPRRRSIGPRSALGPHRPAPGRGGRLAQRVRAASAGARSPRPLTTTRSRPSQPAIDNSSAWSSAAT